MLTSRTPPDARFTARFAARLGRHGSSGNPGFTLVELLVVIAIILLILAVLFPMLGKLRSSARSTADLVNHRSIATACSQYATENGGRLPSPRTDQAVSGVRHCWVNASGSGLVGGVETQKSMENGVIWDYMNQNHAAYKSPLDPTQRVRSYSINAYVGNVSCPDDFGCGTMVPIPAGQNDLSSSALSKIPNPANTMCSIAEESPAGWNQQGFLVNWNIPFWTDIPAFWDGYRVNLSYMDGSTGTLTIFGERFIAEATAAGGSYTEPNEPGTWFAMRQVLLPGRLDF